MAVCNVLVCTQSQEQLDLKCPRDQKNRMTGIAKRAYSAHLNLLEGYPIDSSSPSHLILFLSFPGFLAAMVVAVLCKAPAPIRFHMAALHLLTRLLYWALYLADLDYARTFVWLVGLWCNLILFGWALMPGFEGWFGRLGAMTAGTVFKLK